MALYVLTTHEPYESPEHPVPINATIVSADTLRHPSVPQPDGGRMFRCVTEFPGRRAEEVVPISTLTNELDGGALWPQVADWEAVTAALVDLARQRQCDALSLSLDDVDLYAVVGGPATVMTLYSSVDGSATEVGPVERDRCLAELARHVGAFISDGGPLWPGDGLVVPPAEPVRLPYRPKQQAPAT